MSRENSCPRDTPCQNRATEPNAKNQLPSALGGKNVSLVLSEHEALMANCPEVSVEHVILGVSRHAQWRAVLQEMGLDHGRLRQLLSGKGGDRLATLPMTADLQSVLARARELCGGASAADVPPCGLHLLEAITESDCPAARIILRESCQPAHEVIAKWRGQCPHHRAKGSCLARWLWNRHLISAYIALVAASALVYLLGVAISLWSEGDPKANAQSLGLIVFILAASVFWSAPVLGVIGSAVCLIRTALKRKDK